MRSGALRRTTIQRCFGGIFGSLNNDDVLTMSQKLREQQQQKQSTTSIVGEGGASLSSSLSSSSFSPLVIGSNTAISSNNNALAAPLVPRVLSWYKPDSSFSMSHVLQVLEEKGVVPECRFPLTAAPSSSPLATPSSSSGGGSTTTSSSSAAAAAALSAAATKQLEIIGFSIDQSSSSSPFRSHHHGSGTSSGGGMIPVKTTYFVFADGSLVGWNASWDEMVYMRGLLSPSAAAPPTSTTTASSSSSSLSLDNKATNSFEPSSATFSSPASSIPTASSSTMSVESMRYQLFLTLPMSERPHDAEPQEAQTYIDADKDRIILADDSDIAKKLPYSYALVQSVKLDAMHTSLEPVSQQVKYWQQQLSVDGRLVCTLTQLRKAKTNLLALNEALNFGHLHLQTTTPRIFWSGEFHAVRGFYRDACSHLEIDDRSASLKAQMESLDETLSYLHDEAHAGENEWLTWVIIVLIAFEALAALGVFERVMGCVIDLLFFRGDDAKNIVTSNHNSKGDIASPSSPAALSAA